LFSEVLFLIDIIINFFKQGVDEQGNSLRDPLSEVATSYLNCTFCIDLIAFIPWGYLLASIDYKMKIFWVIKAIRIGKLNHYMTDRMILPIINQQIYRMERQVLLDERKAHDTIEDHSLLTQKIYIANIIRLCRLVS